MAKSKTTHSYIIPIAKQFAQHQNIEDAAGAKAYMRNQFEFYGLKTPLRRQLTKEYIKKNKPDYKDLERITIELWSFPQREFQYFAIELIASLKKQWDIKIIDLIEFIIVNKSWWDTVDFAASELTGPYFQLFPQQIKSITGRWNKSENFWLLRSSIMFQKAYKKNTDADLLSKYILRHKDSKEFFIQKAIGWALREYSKTNPQWVKSFIKKNPLAPLSKREGLKRIN